MSRQANVASRIEQAATPLNWKIVAMGLFLMVLFFGGAYVIAGRTPVRSLGTDSYALMFLVFLDICCTLAIVETWRLCAGWEELKRLLPFLIRLPLIQPLPPLPV